MIKIYLKLFSSLIIIVLLLSCEKEVSVSEPYDFDVGVGKFYISTRPEGAAIFINNKNLYDINILGSY